MLNYEEFHAQLWSLRTVYRTTNPWVPKSLNQKWDDDDVMTHVIKAAYELYAATAGNQLKMVLLGDTEIRQDSLLIPNFGVMSAHGIQESETRRLVIQERYKRWANAERATGPMKEVAKVASGGSILSDSKWTPILNDALILGAIESQQEFHLALNQQERIAWTDHCKPFDEATQKDFAARNHCPPDLWPAFFKKQPQLLWNGKFPRVLSREILALKFFGYKPSFSIHGLSFIPKLGNSIGPPSFKTYNEGLQKAGFFENSESRVLDEIALYLFEDSMVLRSSISSPALKAA